jgi:hypothetical protein
MVIPTNRMDGAGTIRSQLPEGEAKADRATTMSNLRDSLTSGRPLTGARLGNASNPPMDFARTGQREGDRSAFFQRAAGEGQTAPSTGFLRSVFGQTENGG